MGGKSSPNLQDVASIQGDVNDQVIRAQTYANRPTQMTPWGYTSWSPEAFRDPASGETVTRWNQTQGLTPELQNILNKQIALQGGRTDLAGGLTQRMAQEFGAPMDWRGLSPMGTVPNAQFTLPEGDVGSPYETRQRAEDAMFNQARSRLDPMFQSRRDALEIKLRNQGLRPEDQAYQSQMRDLGQQETDAYNQAMWSATGEGRAEAGQMFGQMMGRNQNLFNQALQANAQNFGQALTGSQYANQIRQQQLAEAMQRRGFSLNEINALLSGQQVQSPQMPNFATANLGNPANLYQSAVDQANLQAGQNQSMWGGIGDLAGAGLGAYATYAGLAASDRRLKRNIQRIGTVKGYPWYSFDYIWGEPAEGVMADEVPDRFVNTSRAGYAMVDYGGLLNG